MKNNRKQYSNEFKAKVALTAFSSLKTIAEVAEEFQINPSLVNKWKAELKSKAVAVFSGNQQNPHQMKEKQIDELYRQVGKLQVENDWLKKKVGFSP